MKRGRIEFNAYFLILVTLILFSAFAVRLYGTLDSQEVKIGEKQELMIETREHTEILELAYTLAATRSVELTGREFIQRSGMLNATCGRSGSYVYWNTPNETCVPTNEYGTYYTILDKQLRTPLQRIDAQYGTTLAEKQFEYYADDKRVVGIADRPESIPIQSKNDRIPITAFGIQVSSVKGGVRANIGWNYWQPNFEIKTNPAIVDINRMRTLYTAIQDNCKYLSRVNQTSCITHQSTVAGMNAQIEPAGNQYYHLVIPSTANSETSAPYRIGIYLEPPVQA